MDVDLIAAAAPRSDQINADDLIGGPQIVTITEVRKGNSEQPVEIVTAEFGPGRPYRPGKSMTRVLLEVWGPKSGTYVGRRLKLYRDPEITFGPSKVGGIRISHMTDLDKAKAIPLTKTRGKKELFRVEPLPSGLQIISAEEADEIAAAIEKAADRAELNAIGAQLKAFDLADHRGRYKGCGSRDCPSWNPPQTWTQNRNLIRARPRLFGIVSSRHWSVKARPTSPNRSGICRASSSARSRLSMISRTPRRLRSPSSSRVPKTKPASSGRSRSRRGRENHRNTHQEKEYNMSKVHNFNGTPDGQSDSMVKYSFSGSPTSLYEHTPKVGEQRVMSVTVECTLSGTDQVKDGDRAIARWKVVDAGIGTMAKRADADEPTLDFESEESNEYGDYGTADAEPVADAAGDSDETADKPDDNEAGATSRTTSTTSADRNCSPPNSRQQNIGTNS